MGLNSLGLALEHCSTQVPKLLSRRFMSCFILFLIPLSKLNFLIWQDEKTQFELAPHLMSKDYIPGLKINESSRDRESAVE